MIKKIRITNHNDRAVRDTTIGKVYDVTFHEKSSRDDWGHICRKDTLCFIDDKGDKVSIWTCDPVYEVVDEEKPKPDTEEDNWNTVNWDEIPEDVDAVLTCREAVPSYYKIVGDQLKSQHYRGETFIDSPYEGICDVIKRFGARVHLRPTPIIPPTPSTPESTQVETSEVEATTTPEFDWSSVDSDVEAVIVYKGGVRQYFKMDGGLLLRRNRAVGDWEKSYYYQTLDEREKCMCDYWCKEAKFLRRPPATKVPEEMVPNQAGISADLIGTPFSELNGIQPFKFDINATWEKFDAEDGESKPPSIHTILQEAQQSILKHHGVTGKVSFTVECSE